MHPLKQFAKIILVLLLLACGYAGYQGYRLIYIGSGYLAKMMCSLVFISTMEPEIIAREDIYDPLLKYFDYQVDYLHKRVTANGPLGLVNRTAYFHPCLGARLLEAGDPEDRNADTIFCKNSVTNQPDQLLEWPAGERIERDACPAGVDRGVLAQALDDAFSEPDPANQRRTRAVVIVYRGTIIAERYAPPFHAETRFLGWSMTKSVTNALVGILVGQGRLQLDSPVDIPLWRSEDDPRRTITLDQLLRMTSGLEFEERYSDPLSDVVCMLFGTADAAGFAAAKDLIHPPGSHWSYSSGTTNVIMGMIRRKFNNDDDYHTFPYKHLFDPLGMSSAVIETDPDGTFVGSSFCYATARDWARFGLLYLQNGIWQGERILPEGWVNYSVRRTEASKQRKYGAHFWRLPEGRSAAAGIPDDMFYAAGHDGQFISIIPDKELVVVRLGMNKSPAAWDQDHFVARILAAVRE